MIEIDEKTHTYSDKDNLVYESVTTVIKKYTQKFDPNGYIARAVAKKEGKTVQEINALWEKMGSDARDKGHEKHKALENFVIKKIEDENNKILIDSFKNLGLQGSLQSEKRIYSKDLLIAGTMDLEENTRGLINIYDFKTNKKIDFFSKYNNRFLDPISHLEDCSYNIYALQLSFYAYLSELQSAKIGRLGILWIDENDHIIYYPVPYMKETIKVLIDHMKNVHI